MYHYNLDLAWPAPRSLQSSTCTVHDINLGGWCMKCEDLEWSGRWVPPLKKQHRTARNRHEAMHQLSHWFNQNSTSPQVCGGYIKICQFGRTFLHDVTIYETLAMFKGHAHQVCFIDHESSQSRGGSVSTKALWVLIHFGGKASDVGALTNTSTPVALTIATLPRQLWFS